MNVDTSIKHKLGKWGGKKAFAYFNANGRTYKDLPRYLEMLVNLRDGNSLRSRWVIR